MYLIVFLFMYVTAIWLMNYLKSIVYTVLPLQKNTSTKRVKRDCFMKEDSLAIAKIRLSFSCLIIDYQRKDDFSNISRFLL